MSARLRGALPPDPHRAAHLAGYREGYWRGAQEALRRVERGTSPEKLRRWVVEVLGRHQAGH